MCSSCALSPCAGALESLLEWFHASASPCACAILTCDCVPPACAGALESLLEGHTDNVRSVVLTFRGRFAVTASDDCTARVWDLQVRRCAS